MVKYLRFFLVLSLISLPSLFAQDHEADHNILRSMLIKGEKALNENNIDMFIENFHKDINVVLPSAEVLDGVDAVRAYHNKMLGDKNSILKSFKVEAKADTLSEIYNGMAVAYGTLNSEYVFATGTELNIMTRWSASLIKDMEGGWKVVSLQFSANMFDNPLMNKATQLTIYIGIACLIIGLIIGFLFFKLFRKKK